MYKKNASIHLTMQSIHLERQREGEGEGGSEGGSMEVGFTTTARAANLNDLVM